MCAAVGRLACSSSTVKEFQVIAYDLEKCKTIQYIEDFLRSNQSNNIDYLKLNLEEHQEINEVHTHKQISSLANDLLKRLQKYGDIEENNKIAMRSGAYNKPIAKENKANNYYDANDPWIDDGYQDKLEDQRMELPAATYDDFVSVAGSITQFYQSAEYKQKLQTMKEFNEKNKQNEQKQMLESKKSKKKQKVDKEQYKKKFMEQLEQMHNPVKKKLQSQAALPPSQAKLMPAQPLQDTKLHDPHLPSANSNSNAASNKLVLAENSQPKQKAKKKGANKSISVMPVTHQTIKKESTLVETAHAIPPGGQMMIQPNWQQTMIEQQFPFAQQQMPPFYYPSQGQYFYGPPYLPPQS